MHYIHKGIKKMLNFVLCIVSLNKANDLMIAFYIWPQAIVTEECPRRHPGLESYTCLCSSVQMSQTLDYLK